MHFSTLDHFSTKTLAETFNLAFSDYVIPMHFNEGQLIEKLTRDGINLEYSVGAFDGNNLVGFILQGLGQWEGKLTAYNGGTGVIPAHRGQKITQQLYAYSIPQLKAAGVKQCLLEVVTRNTVAYKTYEKLGFQKIRTLESYMGEIRQPEASSKKTTLPKGIIFRELSTLDREQLMDFWEYSPSWGYDFAALQRTSAFTHFLGVYHQNQLIGYGALQKNTNRVAQFAIAPTFRRKGLGLQLFLKLAKGTKSPLTVINVDHRSEATLSFLEDIGLNQFLSQFEMILPLNN